MRLRLLSSCLIADVYVPAGWTEAVAPPGTDGWEVSAVAWLLDVLPEGYREQQHVHRYPIGLAVMARHHTEACVDGARQGYRTIRADLNGWLPPSGSRRSWPRTGRRGRSKSRRHVRSASLAGVASGGLQASALIIWPGWSSSVTAQKTSPRHWRTLTFTVRREHSPQRGVCVMHRISVLDR
jgi:hypothetical protein